MNKRKELTTTDVPTLLLTVQQAAEALGIGKDMVYVFIKQGSLPVIDLAQPGQRRKLRISLLVLEQWIMEQTRRQNPQNDLMTSRHRNEEKIEPLKQARKGHVPSQQGKIPTASKQRRSQAS